MSEIRLPLSVIYDTEDATPVSDVVAALLATEALVQSAVSLFPSIIEGFKVNECRISVQSISQQSPLREIFLVSIFFAFQDNLEKEVPVIIENIFDTSVGKEYDTLLTVVFLMVVFYGAGLAVDSIKRMFTDSLPRAKFEELLTILAMETGKPLSELREILESRFSKPSVVKALIKSSKAFFSPSKRNRNAAVKVDRDTIPSHVVQEIPFPGQSEKNSDFNKYKPYKDVDLELHAQDRDRARTGWAAIGDGISPNRLKLTVLDPVQPKDLWGHDRINADIVLVSRLTSDGYAPSEIQVTRVNLLYGKEQ